MTKGRTLSIVAALVVGILAAVCAAIYNLPEMFVTSQIWIVGAFLLASLSEKHKEEK